MKLTFTALLAVIGCVILAGCGPKLAPVLNMPTIPQVNDDIIEIDLEFSQSSATKPDVVQSSAHVIPIGASIVTYVPTGLFRQSNSAKASFNSLEQKIEKVLIGKSFKVLSRSKFEGEVQAGLQTSSANNPKRAGMSEIIRVAGSGTARADYVLQINDFFIKHVAIRSNLLHHEKVRQLRMRHPEVKRELDAMNNKISCITNVASLNAKLIYVKTGEIVWIGSYQLNGFNSGLKQITVEGGTRDRINNASEVESFINSNNTKEARIRRAEDQSGSFLPPIPFTSEKPHHEISIPQYQVVTNVVPFSVSSGGCESNNIDDLESISDNKVENTELAKKVASVLIGTISVQ